MRWPRKLGWIFAAIGLATGLNVLRANFRPAEHSRPQRVSGDSDGTKDELSDRETAAIEPLPPLRAPEVASEVAAPAVASVAQAAGAPNSQNTPPVVLQPSLEITAEPPSTTPVPPATSAAATSSPLPRKVDEPRRVSLAALAAWSKPGLCSRAGDSTAVREQVTERFRQFDAGEQGKLFIDPRLPEGAESSVVGLLARARAEAKRRLGLQPAPPSVFVYFDQQLMKAAACINEEVVAFYDGALHLVLGRADLQQSVVHEYGHHALFRSGLVGPAWAQEGIAMNLAGETWWQQPSRLSTLLQTPFSAEQMDRLIPYKLPSEQAVGFYVQAALTVQCLMLRRGWSLQQLTDALRSGSNGDSVTYALPEIADNAFLRDCVSSK